ncbi:hypothetical protein [Methylorubrum thiocyanatum]|uniref:hypothetical protein n=1 Tax=Methylorubrum thiocyanatum TaxID=47958 RepID=UPI003F809C24
MEPNPDGGFFVKVGGEVAGYPSEDAEHPELWAIQDPDLRFMGLSAVADQDAVFLTVRDY